ncbi:hypothetical protein RF55_12646 [Lasius niger]|uniref:Uncharacterized protein n=1 Tax=Lasius niger TaxID=67767 RepID=A0A0J7KCI6_LASNI|nr:hypothetical protein RF55_12646 [Lasius niger]
MTMKEDEGVMVIEDSDEDGSDIEGMVIADSDEEWDNILEALKDSDYNSDSNDEYVEETHRVLGQADLISMNEWKKIVLGAPRRTAVEQLEQENNNNLQLKHKTARWARAGRRGGRGGRGRGRGGRGRGNTIYINM